MAGVADPIQSPQSFTGKGVVGYGGIGVHISRHGAQIGGALFDFHQRMAVFQGGSQSGHAADIIAAGEMTLDPAVPDGPPGGAGDTAYITAVRAGDVPIVLAGAHPPQVHETHHAAGIVPFSGDAAPVHAGADHGLRLIAEVQGAVSLFDQVILGVEVVFNGHGPYDAGHVDVSLHGPCVPGIGDTSGIRSTGLLVRDVLETVRQFLSSLLQQIPQQIRDNPELVSDGFQIVQ